jgi:prolyl oligopeptidase
VPHRLRASCAAACLALLAALAPPTTHAADTTAPPTPVRPVTDTYHGTAVVDPYRWMEDMGSAEFQDWLRAQAGHTEQVLARIPGREPLRQRLMALSNATESAFALHSAAKRLFYLKSEPGHDQPRLYVRTGNAGTPRLLLDPRHLPGDAGPHSIDFFTPSPDGRLVALGLSRGGSENSQLRVLKVADGTLLPEHIDGTGLNEGVAWLPDNRRFFYNRLPPPDAQGQQERYNKTAVWLHTVGRSAGGDVQVFGWGVAPQRSFAVPDLPYVYTAPGSPWLLAEVLHGDAAERSYHVARASDLAGPATPWRRIIAPADAVTRATLNGQQVFALSQRQASRRELLRYDLARPRAAPAVALPAGEPVLRNVLAGRQAVYVEALDGGTSRLLQVPLRSGPAQPLALPLQGVLRELVPHGAGLLLRMEGWASPAAWWVREAGQPARPLALQAPSTLDLSGIEVQRAMVRSHDGTQVPLSILHRKGLVQDGRRPTILTGYGAYGISMEPRFNPQVLAWLEQGGVMAVAHVRGGGEFGADWHRGGFILTKQNTVSDFIACAQYLVDQRYTQPARLAGTGRSAGGITIGGAITQRPDLFGVAHSGVGVSDMLRMELTPNGAPNVAEFGTVQQPDHFRAMHAISPVHRVSDGTRYPAVIVTTGANDPRVEAWMSGKLAARLQAATASGKPVLLRVDFAGGHGMGSGRAQRVAETADVWSFFLWQMGEPGFMVPPEAPAAPPPRGG